MKLNHCIAIFLLAFLPLTVFGQEKVMSRGAGGSGSAANKKTFTKVLRFIDSESKVPLSNLYFTIARDNTAFFPGKSDENGNGIVMFTMNSYYPKVELNMNDNKYMNETWKERRNAITYKPLDSIIKFSSKKEVRDTTIILLKRIH